MSLIVGIITHYEDPDGESAFYQVAEGNGCFYIYNTDTQEIVTNYEVDEDDDPMGSGRMSQRDCELWCRANNLIEYENRKVDESGNDLLGWNGPLCKAAGRRILRYGGIGG